MNKPLGKMQRVELRTIWQNEAGDFTPWLAQSDNLAVLANILGMELELEAMEESVGSYRADIICRNLADNSRVLIENQLEKTDHSHLGQIVTYAAGLDAVTIVWVAAHFTEQHRAALDWLNEVTGQGIDFFGVEIELWCIDDSPPAPRFNIVSKPNEWTKAVRNTVSQSSTEQMYYEYWTQFIAYLEEKGSRVGRVSPQSGNWLTFSIGRSNFQIITSVSAQKKIIKAYLQISGPDEKAYFHLLQAQHDEIHAAFGDIELKWRESSKTGLITAEKSQDPSDLEQWPIQHQWLGEMLETFYHVFGPRIKMLDASDYVNDDDDATT